jgi:hypothetical protein
VGTRGGEAAPDAHEAATQHRGINGYRTEGVAWQIVHHHTDLAPAIVEVIGRLVADA